MRTVAIVLVLAISACARVVSAPTAVTPAAPIVVHNQALEYTNSWLTKIAPALTCKPWTGRDTSIPGVDSVRCQAPGGTQILWCAAPVDAKPYCDRDADWTPPTKEPETKDAASSKVAPTPSAKPAKQPEPKR